MTSAAAAILPEARSPLGFQSWLREMRILAAATISPPMPCPVDTVPAGDGRAVLLIPGFLTGDWTTQPLRQFLARAGYRAEAAGMVFNAGPTASLFDALSTRVKSLADQTGRPIAVIGQSLGGVFARGLAQDHPQEIDRVITLVTPIRFPVTTPLAPFVWALSIFHDPRFLARRASIALPPRAPVTAIYSKTDGIVDWHQCLQDAAPHYENVHVPGAHTTMGSNAQAQRIVAFRLAGQ
ncbi:MAG: alpha/beta fold hydrolase [Alphaproteobacteria bacterium]|nr:alpha/beta fold hydrolase [Alphaproteobacteria bacterium]